MHGPGWPYTGGYRVVLFTAPRFDSAYNAFGACYVNVSRLMGWQLSCTQPAPQMSVKAGQHELAVYDVPVPYMSFWWQEAEHRDGHRLRYVHPRARYEEAMMWPMIWVALKIGGLGHYVK